jgi:hypothetical protein
MNNSHASAFKRSWRNIHTMARKTHLHISATTWSGRLIVASIALTLLMCAFFFLTFALLAASAVILVALIRVLLPIRKVHASAAGRVIDGEYSVKAEARDLTNPTNETDRQQPGCFRLIT